MRIPFRDPGWVATVSAGVVALGLAASILALRVVGTSELAVIPTEAWPWTSESVGVDGVGSQTLFRAGDRVAGMNGIPMTTWVSDAVRPPWQGPPATIGQTVTFAVVRDGATISLDVPLEPFPVERFGSAPISLIVFGAGVLVLALVLMLRRTRSTALRLLFVGAAANVADITAWEVGLQPTDFGLPGPMIVLFGAASLFNIVFWSTIVHILTIYPVRSPLAVRRPALISAIYAAPLAAFLGLVVVAWLAGGTSLDRIDRLAACMALVGSGMLVLVGAATIAGYRRTTGMRRRQVRWIAATLLFAAGATLVLLTLPIVLTGRPLVQRSTVSFLVLPVPIALANAVIRDRLFQVGLLSRSREQIVAAREEERRKLRRELHDGLAPTLAGVGIKLDLARQGVRDDPAGVETLIDEARSEVRTAIGEIRRMARELRPPTLDALGLEGALREQAAGLTAQSADAPVIIVEVPEPLPALPAAVEVAAYRIAVEALMNVVRHASAHRAEVRLVIGDDELAIDVVDDGRGSTEGKVGVGTRAMRERAAEVGGEVTIETSATGGTRVLARLPVERSRGAPE